MFYRVACKRFINTLLVSLIVFTPPAFAATKYASDQLTVPVRSGASNQHRIIKFISSGTGVEFIAEDEGGKYSQVRLSDGKEGYILNDNLMDAPGGREQLETAKRRLESTRAENKELKREVAELKSELAKYKGEVDQLENERTRLSNSIEDIKITAANPLALSRKNKQLEDDLDKATSEISRLEKDNDKLRNNVMQEWFIIGAAVSLGSLILGIILTRIRWKKRDNWGGGF